MLEMLATLAVVVVAVPSAMWVLKRAGYFLDVTISFSSHPFTVNSGDDDGDGDIPSYTPRFPSAHEDN